MVPTKKRANIQWDARRTRERAEIIFWGRATTRRSMSEPYSIRVTEDGTHL